jgi:hypothetical protein
MNLLDRYLAALKPLLPRGTQDDILQEIADEVQSQMEEESEAFGRPLTEEEEADVIRKHGHPLVVAARYGQPRYLIGPELFPFYWRTLKLSLVAATAIWVVIIAVGLMSSADPAHQWMPLLLRVPGALITVFGVLTACFGVAQLSRSFVRLKGQPRWNPRTLPQAELHGAKRTQSAFEVLFGVAGLVWWQLLPSMPLLALGPGARFLELGPAWDALHWPVLVFMAAHIGKSVVQFIWPERRRSRAKLAVLLHVAELLVLLYSLHAGDWVVASATPQLTAHAAAVANALNRLAGVACFIALLVRTVQFAFRCIHLWRESGHKRGWRAASAL